MTTNEHGTTGDQIDFGYRTMSSDTPARITLFDGARGAEPLYQIEYKSIHQIARKFLRTTEVSEKKQAPLFSRGQAVGGRLREDVLPPYMIILDVDGSKVSMDECSGLLANIGVAHVGHTTWSHAPESTGVHNYRIITDLIADDWRTVRGLTRELSRTIDVEIDSVSEHQLCFFVPATDGNRDVERVEHLELTTWNPDPSVWHDLEERDEEGSEMRAVRDPADIDVDKLCEALESIPNGERSQWIRTGQCLHGSELEEARELWDDWSMGQDYGDYDSDAQDEAWNSFDGNRLGIGTVFFDAQNNGWKGRRPSAREDFDDGRMNFLKGLDERYAYVAMGQGKVADLRTRDGVVRFLSTTAFKGKWRHPMLPTERPIPAQASAGAEWLDWWPDRPTFDDVDFLPPGSGEELSPDILNLWRGWPYKAAARSCDRYLEHVKEVICCDDDEMFAWVVAWMAHLVQKPWEKPGTAIVLKSIEGTGKGVFANTLVKLCGDHGIQVTQLKQLTGNFNHHMAGKLIVFADEVTWGGNKSKDGVLKAMITESNMIIEPKGVDAIKTRCFSRIVISSNNDWVIPAGRSARRFLVLDVSDARVGNRPYFQAIVDELNAGGYAGLMHYLSGLDLSEFPDPTTIIKTDALRDQKIESLDDRGKWLLTILQNGCVTGGSDFADSEDQWPRFVPSGVLYDSYLGVARDMGSRRKSNEMRLANLLKEVFGAGCSDTRMFNGRRSRGYVFPSLGDARKLFEKWLNSEIDWMDAGVKGDESENGS